MIDTRGLQILMGEFNQIWKWPLWGTEIALMCVTIFGNCGAVWGEGPRKIHMALTGLTAFVVLAITFSNVAIVYHVARSVLSEWKGCKSKRAMFSKFLRSTPPLRVVIGANFTADKAMVLSCLKIITENSVSLLVSQRK